MARAADRSRSSQSGIVSELNHLGMFKQRVTMTDTKRPAALAAFLPELEADDFSTGEMVRAKTHVDGVTHFPYANFGDTPLRLLEMLDREGWITPFDWPAWIAEARRLSENEAALASADADQLAKLLTTIVRRDRFSWGDPLYHDFESGLILRIVRRADALLAESRNHSLASRPDTSPDA